MTILYAQPYDISATGFYFKSTDEYEEKVKDHRNHYGDLVVEYEIQFIDGERLDCVLANAWGVTQSSFALYFEKIDNWEDDQKIRYIVAVGECGYEHSQVVGNPEQTDIDIYYVENLNRLAEQFVDEGLFGDIPEHLTNYIDYDAITRDLSFDYTETEIDGQSIVYRCA